MSRTTFPVSTKATSRAPGPWIGGGAGLVDRGIAGAAGGGARCEDVARELGALAGLRWRQDLVAVARRPTLAALPRTGDRDGAGLVQAQQLAESEIQARGDPLGHLQGRA